MTKKWPLIALALALTAGIAWATTVAEPFHAAGGVQSTPQASWNGKDGSTGYYIKPDAGMMYHPPSGAETKLGSSGGGGGSISGTISTAQVAYASGSDTLAGFSGFTFDQTSGLTLSGTSDVLLGDPSGGLILFDSGSYNTEVDILSTGVTLGQTTTLAANKSIVLASGSGGADFSSGSGVTKTTTGQLVMGSSSFSFNAATTKILTGFSLVDHNVNVGDGTSAPGSVTIGNVVQFTQPVTVYGIRFWWPGGLGSLSVKCTIWDPSSSAAANATVAVSAAAAFTATFSGAVTVNAAHTYQNYTIGCWETTGAKYVYTGAIAGRPGGAASATNDNVAFTVNPWMTMISDGLYHSGDGQPTSELGAATQFYALEPVFTAP